MHKIAMYKDVYGFYFVHEILQDSSLALTTFTFPALTVAFDIVWALSIYFVEQIFVFMDNAD